jgi:benzoyl-CoA 2,3-dioxygenase component B
MLTEEAHHMFVGETGIMRIIQRTCEVMRELRTDDPERLRVAGVIDLPTLQRFIHFHYSVSLDLFGQERSTNAATYFTTGLKGRYRETRIDDDHRLTDATWPVHSLVDGRMVCDDQPALLALNERLRDDYMADCQRGLDRWNKVIESHRMGELLQLPHRAFNRRIGAFVETHISPDGAVLSESEWEQGVEHWLPTHEDHAYIASLMQPVIEPGEMAGWISPPARGIHGQPIDFRYVTFL